MDKRSENGVCRSYGSVSLEPSSSSWSPSTYNDDGDGENNPLLVNDVKLNDSWLKRRIWLNVCRLNAMVFFLYLGMIPIVTVQSSLNSDAGLGVFSLAIKNGFMIVGSVIAPSVIQRFGCKTSAIIGLVCYATYVPANFYPSWATLVPFSMLSGIGCTVHSIAIKVYLARLAHLYARLTNMDEDRINSRMFVLVLLFVYLSYFGNLISSLILNVGTGNSDANYNNVTVSDAVRSRMAICGAKYCNQLLVSGDGDSGMSSNSTASKSPEEMERIYLLVGFCTVSCLVALAFVTFLDPLSTFSMGMTDDKRNTSPLSVFKNLLKAMKDPLHVLFIPMAISLNGGDSFWGADFNKAFIACAMGVSQVGYVTLWNGLGAGVACLSLGWFNTKTVRSLPVVVSTLLQLFTLTALFYWTPSATSDSFNYWTLSMYTLVFHVGSGIRNFIAPVLISVVFKDNLETAFSVYHLWTNASSTLFYAWSSFLCVYVKIYVLMAVMAISFIGYVGLELLAASSGDRSALQHRPIS